jgi:hypothetical protein
MQARAAREVFYKAMLERADITPDSKWPDVQVLMKEHPAMLAVEERERNVYFLLTMSLFSALTFSFSS